MIDLNQPHECVNLFNAFRNNATESRRILRSSFDSESDPLRRILLAITLLHLRDPKPAQQVLSQYAPNPELRTQFIDTYAKWRGNLLDLQPLLKANACDAFRSGMLTSIAKIVEPKPNLEQKQLDWIKANMGAEYIQSPYLVLLFRY